MTRYALLAGAALALAACAQPEPQPAFSVSDVQVEADVTAISSRQAAAFWGGLETDLATAIAGEFVGQTDPEGLRVQVDVDEIALANLLSAPLGADEARLSGQVTLVNPLNEVVERTFLVSASANEAVTFLPVGTNVAAISPTSAEFYQAVVRAFARGVAETARATPLADS
jgi:hypothetical protein